MLLKKVPINLDSQLAGDESYRDHLLHGTPFGCRPRICRQWCHWWLSRHTGRAAGLFTWTDHGRSSVAEWAALLESLLAVRDTACYQVQRDLPKRAKLLQLTVNINWFMYIFLFNHFSLRNVRIKNDHRNDQVLLGTWDKSPNSCDESAEGLDLFGAALTKVHTVC